jgi:hypothetical protein
MYFGYAQKLGVPVEAVRDQMRAAIEAADLTTGKAGWNPSRPPGTPTRGGPQTTTLTSQSDILAFYRAQTAVPAITPLIVRQYAAPRPGSSDAVTFDEADTLLWQPVIVLPADGKATLGFTLGSAPGGYQVMVAGHTLDGRIGAVRGLIPVAGPGQTGQPALPGAVPPKAP